MLQFIWFGNQEEQKEGRNSGSKDTDTCDNSGVSSFPSPKVVKVKGGELPGKHGGNHN